MISSPVGGSITLFPWAWGGWAYTCTGDSWLAAVNLNLQWFPQGGNFGGDQVIWFWSSDHFLLTEWLSAWSPSMGPTSPVLPTLVSLPYWALNLWRNFGSQLAGTHPRVFLWKALEKDQAISGEGRIADKLRQTSGSFILLHICLQLYAGRSQPLYTEWPLPCIPMSNRLRNK